MILLQKGAWKSKKTERFARRNIHFLRNFNDFAPKRCLEVQKKARCARRNLLFPKDFQGFLQKGVSKTREKGALRAPRPPFS